MKAAKGDERDRYERHRFIHEPERLDSDEGSDASGQPEITEVTVQYENNHHRTRKISICSESGESDGELSDHEIEKRRQMLKLKMMQQQKEEEVLQKEDEGQSEGQSDSEESSDYDEESESEEENQPRLKPLFVRKKDRTTIIEKERDLIKQKQIEYEAKKAAKDRRRQTLRLVEDSVKKDLEAQKAEKNPNINDVCTDDENDELEYDAWKLRELKRIKRDREEREA